MILELALAAYSAYSANQASNAADKQQAKADALAADTLAFSREQLAQWEQNYGSIERNLSAYYKGLDVGEYTAKSLQQFEQEKNRSLTAMREQLAQRGLESSGLAVDLEFQTALQSASQRASIRQDAPAKIAEQQQGFMTVGLSRDPSKNVQSTLTTQAADAGTLASQYNRTAGKAQASAVEAFGKVIDSTDASKALDGLLGVG